MAMTAIVTVIAAYLIGSINFAVIFAKAFTKRDVREMGSGNAGATNVLRNAGLLPGILTFLFDALKGFASCYMGKVIFEYVYKQTGYELSKAVIGAYLCGVACMLGHVFPFFFEFKGGKGAAISVGIFVICCPEGMAAGLVTFIIAVIITKYVSLGSILGAVAVVLTSIIFTDKNALFLPQALCAVAMGVIVIAKHKDNIKRLISGTESKIKIGGK